jgi:tRNA-Thr(GGU) m(6)t(6)A37 methyltransferase TsaA
MQTLYKIVIVLFICQYMTPVNPVGAQESIDMAVKQITMKPVGIVKKKNNRTSLHIDKQLQPALKGLEAFSHVWVLWWFDRNDNPEKRSVLQVHPRGNILNPLTGVFACRSPARPNLIALSLCRIISVEGNVVRVESIDAFSNTPIVDLKPYIPGYDSATASVPDWLKNSR